MAALLLTLAISIGQNAGITGRVVDRQDQPIRGAVVWVAGGDDKASTATDASGQFTIQDVNRDAPFLFARHPRYAFFGQRLPHDETNLSIVLSTRDQAAADPPLLHVERPRDERNALARRLLGLAWSRLDTLDGDDADDLRREVLYYLAIYDPEVVLRRLPRIKNARYLIGPLIELGKFDDAVEAAMAFNSPEGRGFALREVAEKHPDPARRRELLGQAAAECRAILEADRRVWALGGIARCLYDAGDERTARKLIDEILPAAEDFVPGTYRTAFAMNMAIFDIEKALRLCEGATDHDRDAAFTTIAKHLAGRDPQWAEALFRRASPSRQANQVIHVATAMAKTDLKRARRLVDDVSRLGPDRVPMAYGCLALALRSDREAAHKLLFDAFDLLEAGMHSPTSDDYFPQGAALVHTVERIDPSLTRECLWRAVALGGRAAAKNEKSEQSSGKTNESLLRDARLSVLLARYGAHADVAARLAEPLFGAQPSEVPREELPTRCFAMAAIDPERAEKWLKNYLAATTPEQLRAVFPEPWTIMTEAAAGDDRGFWITFNARVFAQWPSEFSP